MPRVFISHSTDPQDAAAVSYVRSLVSGIEAMARDGKPVCEVFFDRESLTCGDDWRQKIVNHLVCCDAAVLLLTPRALKSEFVRFEASNLLARYLRERDAASGKSKFPLIPLIPWFGQAPNPTAVKTEIERALGHGFWGTIDFRAVNYAGPLGVEEAVQALAPKLSGVTPQPEFPLEPIAKELFKRLAKVHRSSLEDAARQAHVDISDQLDDRAVAMCLARGLLLCTGSQIFDTLAVLNGDLTDHTTRLELFELLAPYWVSPEAALCLSEGLSRHRMGFCPIVNGTLVGFTPEMYVRRARGQVSRLAGKFLQVHEPTNADDVAELRRRIGKHFVRDRENAADYFARVKREVEKQTSIPRPVVVAMPLSSEASLRTLIEVSAAEEFKRLVFFGLSGELDIKTADLPVVRLAPPLVADQELFFSDQHEVLAEAWLGKVAGQ